MIRRLFKIFFILVILIVLFVGFGMPMLASTEKGREEVAKILGRSLDRDVAVAGLDIGWFFSSLDVKGLTISNPDGYPKGNLLEAESVEFDTKLKRILDGEVTGGLKAEGIVLHIIKKDGGTNLDGLAGSDDEKPADQPDDDGEKKDDDGGGSKDDGGKGPDLDLSLELANSKLKVTDLDKNEEIVIDGVGLTMQLTNKKGAAAAKLKLRIAMIDTGTVKVRELEIDATQAGDYLEIEKLRALLPGKGQLAGDGRLRVRGGDDWTVKLQAQDVDIEQDMQPLVAGMLPFASSAKGQAAGVFGAKFEVRGNGLTWDAMKPSLAGNGEVTLANMSLPEDSVLVLANKLAGGTGGAMDLKDAAAKFGIKNGWLDFTELFAASTDARYDLGGRVSLDGQLDMKMDIMPLVKQFGGGKAYKEAAKYVDSLPLGIRGTTDKPKLDPPKLDNVAKDAVKKKLTDELDKGIGKALDKWKKKKKDD